MNILLLILVIFFALAFYFIKMWFLSELKASAPNIWESLGKPSPYANNFSFLFASKVSTKDAAGSSIDAAKWMFILKMLFLAELVSLLAFAMTILI